MSLHDEPLSAPKGCGWLASYRDSFLTELGSLGYAAKTIGDYQRAIDEFCLQVEARGLNALEIGTELAANRCWRDAATFARRTTGAGSA